MNAFTTHEQTVFYVRVPDAQLELAIDILADVVWSPAFRARRGRRRAPGDPRRDRDARRHARRPRARPVRERAVPGASARPRGARQPTTSITGDAARRHRRVPRARTTSRRTSWSRPPATSTTSACVELVEARRPGAMPARPGAAASRRRPRREPLAVVHRPTPSRRTSSSACASLPRSIPTATRSSVVNQVLGGGMSSRLFQEVREQRGLAYSVYSYRAAFDDTGLPRDLRGHRARTRARDARRDRRPSSTGSSPTACPTPSSTRPRATSGVARDVARDVGEPDAPPRPRRARRRRGPDARRARRAHRGRDRRRHRAA